MPIGDCIRNGIGEVIAATGATSGTPITPPSFSCMALPQAAGIGDGTPRYWLPRGGASTGLTCSDSACPANHPCIWTIGFGHDRFTVFCKKWSENRPYWWVTRWVA